jgi:[ribosomal protein S18]-alanine N-acetyltransferase
VIADIAVRLARRADAAAIAALSRDEIEHGLPWRWRAGRIAEAIADADTNVAVADGPTPGTLAGFGIMVYRDVNAHLLLFAVHPSQRRRGVGSALLLWLETVARTAGIARIRLEARQDNAAARCFYSEHGYHERTLRPGMYSDAVHGVQLEKWLQRE